MGRLTKKFDDGYGSTDCYHSCFDCYGEEAEAKLKELERRRDEDAQKHSK